MKDRVSSLRRRAKLLASERSVEDCYRTYVSLSGGDMLDRQTAGYLLKYVAGRRCELSPGQATIDLIEDDKWEVREAATFGIRDAFVDNYEVMLPYVLHLASRFPSPRRLRALLVICRLPRSVPDSAMTPLVPGLMRALSCPDAYVVRNIPFFSRYLERSHPALLNHILDLCDASDSSDLLKASALIRNKSIG